MFWVELSPRQDGNGWHQSVATNGNGWSALKQNKPHRDWSIDLDSKLEDLSETGSGID